MPSTPTTRLRVEKQALGENAALWGAPKLNAALDRLEEGIAGVTSIAIAGATTTLTATNYVADQARYGTLVFTGTLAANSTIVVPNVEKLYVIVNNTTQGAYSLTIKTAAGTGYALRPGPQQVYCDGTDVYRATPTLEQLPIGQVVADSSGNIGVGYTTVPTGGATVRVLAVKGPNSGVGYGTLQVEGGTNTKKGMVQVSGTNGDVELGCQTDNLTGTVKFYTGGTAQAALAPTGEFIAGATALLGVYGTPGALTGRHTFGVRHALRLEDNGTALAVQAVFINANGAVGSITTTGSATAYNTSSDYRLKQGIEPLTLAVDRLSQLRPRRFAFKSAPDIRLDGFIAHEVAAVCPEAVTGEKDGLDMQALDAAKLVPLLVAAVQELTRRIELLEDVV
jgi:hypothetical protein